VINVQEIHSFSPRFTNELRLGYAFNSNNTLPKEPATDAEVGISRANSSELPG